MPVFSKGTLQKLSNSLEGMAYVFTTIGALAAVGFVFVNRSYKRAAAEQREQERSVRLKTEGQSGPRTLTLDQQKSIESKLRTLPGRIVVNVVGFSDDQETKHIANQVVHCLRNAGWRFTYGMNTTGTVSGIRIELELGASTSDQQAANSLAAALAHENIAVTGPLPRPPEDGDAIAEAKVILTIGKKLV
jgi:hypothetical protein